MRLKQATDPLRKPFVVNVIHIPILGIERGIVSSQLPKTRLNTGKDGALDLGHTSGEANIYLCDMECLALLLAFVFLEQQRHRHMKSRPEEDVQKPEHFESQSERCEARKRFGRVQNRFDKAPCVSIAVQADHKRLCQCFFHSFRVQNHQASDGRGRHHPSKQIDR